MDVTNSEDQSWKKARRGTKSCTECRRRKVRCIRSPEDAQSCRRCDERGSECIEQIYSSRPLNTKRVPSRHRISQLESKVANLSKVLRDIEFKLGYPPTQISEPTPTQAGSSPGADESDDDSSTSELFNTDPPSQLHSLFQNDWVTVDTRPQDKQLQDRQEKASSHLLDLARPALQKLIPSKEGFSKVARSASEWLVLLHTLLPQQAVVNSYQEYFESYDEMNQPDVNVISLASWLLVIAIATQQSPDESGSPATQLKGYHRRSDFIRAISDTVESTIIAHDRLICTVKGLGMAMHFFRLTMSQGNFQKSWLRLRHFIAIGELMGLPKSSQAVQLNKANGLNVDKAQLERALLWDSICAADGLSGMVINLPPCTRRYQHTNTQALSVGGVVQPQVYLSRLTDITTNIQYRDDMNTGKESSEEVYASALELDRQLRALASQTPKFWWVRNTINAMPDHVAQFLHYCSSMRVHLPFAMRQDPSEQYIYSRLACTEACESVAEIYLFLRRKLPSRIFISHNLDLQAFTATVVLLLTSHSVSYMDRSNSRINKANIDELVGRVVKLMDEKSKEPAATKFAQNGVTTIRSLFNLLQNDDETSNFHELTLKIPLLGKVHIRRNSSTSRVPNASILPPSSLPISSNSILQKPCEDFTPREHGPLPFNADAYVAPIFQTQGDWQGDPLSWSIEGQYENFFQDALMGEEIDPFAMWQNNYSGFQSNS